MPRHATPLIDRFNQKLPTDKDTNGCLLWDGAVNSHGYGTIRRGPPKQTSVGAHVIAWEFANGPVPDGLCVLHRCDVRRCVNPEHLFLGTKGENNADRDQKGRPPRGERSGRRKHPDSWDRSRWTPPNTKLNEENVREIRRRHSAGETLAEIGRAFGVTYMCIGAITKRLTWKHVE